MLDERLCSEEEKSFIKWTLTTKRKIIQPECITTPYFDRFLQADGNGSEWKELLRKGSDK